MSLGRQGKLAASVQQRAHGKPAPHVAPLHLPKPAPHLWRDADAADSARADVVAAASAGVPAQPAPLPSDPRAWSWERILAASAEHGTEAKPYGSGVSVGSRVERPASRSDNTAAGSQSARAALESSSGRRVALASAGNLTHQTPSDGHDAFSPTSPLDAYVAHTQTRTTTTTTVTQQQSQVTESISAILPIPAGAQKPRAVGDGGAMLSYGREDGPSRFTSAMLPALRTSERAELAQLGEALDYFVASLESQRLRHVRVDDRSSVEQLMALLREEQAVYDLFFDEIIRQVGVQSRERGAVLGKIRQYYAAMMLRLPMHLYAVQSELATQQALNRSLQEEARQGREHAFAVQVELGAYTHRFKEAAHELEMHRDMLSRAEHEKDRARAMFVQFKAEWDSQRAALEAQVALLREEREDYLATASATASALAKSRRPNPFAHALLDSDSEGEGELDEIQKARNARLAFLKDMAQDDDTDLLSATVLQIERDQLKSSEKAARAQAEKQPGKNTEAELQAQREEENRLHLEAAKRQEQKRREAEQVTAAAAAALRPAQHDPLVAAAMPATASIASAATAAPAAALHRHPAPGALSALPDFTAGYEEDAAEDALLPIAFHRQSVIAAPHLTPAQRKEARRAQLEKREAKQVRRALASSPQAQEAWQSRDELLAAWVKPGEAPLLTSQLALLLPQLPRTEIERVAAHPVFHTCIPLLVDFLTRVESYPFNHSELLVIRQSLPVGMGMPLVPATPPSTEWTEALQAELARRGMGAVAAELFSQDTARKSYLAAIARDLSSSSSEDEAAAATTATPSVASSPKAAPLSAQPALPAESAEQMLNELMSLADPNASQSLRRATLTKLMAAGEEAGPVSVAMQKERKKTKKQARATAAAAAAAEGDAPALSRPVSGLARSRGHSKTSSTSSISPALGPSRAPSSRARQPSEKALGLGADVSSPPPAPADGRRLSSSTKHLETDSGASTPTASTKKRRASSKQQQAVSPKLTKGGSSRQLLHQHSAVALRKDGEEHAPQAVQRAASSLKSVSRTASVTGYRLDDGTEMQVEMVAGGSEPCESARDNDAPRAASNASNSSAAPRLSVSQKVDLASRRTTLPLESDQLADPRKGSERMDRPKSISHIASGAEQAATAQQNTKQARGTTHHRHHSRADGPESHAPANQDYHPLQTLLSEHNEAANDARANDDHEVKFRAADTTPEGATVSLSEPAPTSETPPSEASPVAPVVIESKPAPRAPVNSNVPRSFYEASQLVPMSKITVTPRGGAPTSGSSRSGAAVKPHQESARERELQGVIDDLIAQNELLHAQRQALAAMQGVKDTGAPALPASMTSQATAAPAAGQTSIGEGLTPQAVQAPSHSGMSVTEKQNHLLAKVNEYLQAYRISKKLGNNDASTPGASAAAPTALPSLPDVSAPATARNFLSGRSHNLLFHSRFLQLLQSSSHPLRKSDSDESKEASAPLTGRGKKGSAPPAAQLSLPWLVRWIRSLYDAKLARDDIARKESTPLLRLPEFLLESQRKLYGLESLVVSKTWEVARALHRFRDADREVGLFVDFLEESRPIDELILFLRTRAVVQGSTVGILWSGHVHERPTAAAAATGTTKSCLEFMSLCRARSVIASIFSSNVALQDAVYKEVLARSCFWHAIPDPIPAAKWATLLPGAGGAANIVGGPGRGGSQQVDERCVALVDFLDCVLAQFRAIELQLRHHQWAEDLWNSAIASSRAQAAQEAAALQESGQVAPRPSTLPISEERMEFSTFQQVFALAEPRYSAREIAQLFSNVTRNAGLRTLSRALFKQLIHQLMSEGALFPLLQQPNYERTNVLRMLMRHWAGFRAFFTRVLESLQHSERAADVACANSLQSLRVEFEHELSQAASGHAGGGGAGSGIGTSVDGDVAAASSTRRLVALYRGLLHVLSAHQSSFQLAHAEPPPLRALHTELKVLAHVVVQRQRAIEQADARPDAWLEGVDALESQTPGAAFTSGHGEDSAGQHRATGAGFDENA